MFNLRTIIALSLVIFVTSQDGNTFEHYRQNGRLRYAVTMFDALFGRDDLNSTQCGLIKSFNRTSKSCTDRLMEVCANTTLRLMCKYLCYFSFLLSFEIINICIESYVTLAPRICIK